MKKSLLVFVGMAALMASCTNDDFLMEEQGQASVDLSKGIVFKAGNEAATRGEFNTDAAGNFYTAWNAEEDKIGVIYTGVIKGLDGTGPADATNWCTNGTIGASTGETSLTGIATYKTTRSGGFGYFTGNSDDDVLKFADAAQSPAQQVKASFRIFTPYVSGSTTVKYSTDEKKVPTMNVTVPAFNTQEQADGKANFKNFFMVADPIDNLWVNDQAVGEALTLSFERPFAALAIRTKGYDATTYGKLKSVVVETEESYIASSADMAVDVAKKDKDGKWTLAGGTGVTTVTLDINSTNSGEIWSDNYYAFIQILPVDRSKAEVDEDYSVTLKFEKGDITFEKSTRNSWAANSFIGIELDLNAQPYTYLGNAGGDPILIINSAMPELTEGKFGNSVAATSIKEFTSKVVLSTEDLETLNAFTSIEKLTLANQAADLGENLSAIEDLTALTTLTLSEATTAPVITSYAGLITLNLPKVTTVPDEAFNGNSALTKVNMPLVQTIGNNAFEGADNLTTIGCNNEAIIIGTTNATTHAKTSALTSVGSFAFSGIQFTSIDAPQLATIGSRAFGMSALTNLSTVLLPKYNFADAYNAMALLGSTALTEVDLSAVDELSISTISFNSTHTALAKVTLKDGVKIGTSAFMGCSALATVNNLNKAVEIGEKAFMGTKLSKVLVNVATIGKEAFKDCGDLATVTLGANVKTIGEGAFQNATNLNVINNLALVETIGKNAFNGCSAITTFDYTNATLGEGAFQDCEGLVGQVRSNVTTLEKNVFNGANKVSTFVFPNVTTIKEGALNALLADEGSSAFATITFGAELASIDAKAFTDSFEGGGDGSTAAKAKTATVKYNIVLTGDQSNLDVDDNVITYKATDGKYYAITFNSVM